MPPTVGRTSGPVWWTPGWSWRGTCWFLYGGSWCTPEYTASPLSSWSPWHWYEAYGRPASQAPNVVMEKTGSFPVKSPWALRCNTTCSFSLDNAGSLTLKWALICIWEWALNQETRLYNPCIYAHFFVHCTVWLCACAIIIAREIWQLVTILELIRKFPR